MARFIAEAKVWESVKVPYPFSMDSFLGEEILKKLKETPQRVCQVFHEAYENSHELTCDELRVKSVRVAQNLNKLGFKADDVVGIICRPSHDLSIALYGCIFIGAPVNPLDISFSKDDLKQMFSQTLPKLVVCDSDMVSKARKALCELNNDAPIFSITSDDEKETTNFSKLLMPTGEEDNFVSPKFEARADEKTFAIMFTSGSTG